MQMQAEIAEQGNLQADLQILGEEIVRDAGLLARKWYDDAARWVVAHDPERADRARDRLPMIKEKLKEAARYADDLAREHLLTPAIWPHLSGYKEPSFAMTAPIPKRFGEGIAAVEKPLHDAFRQFGFDTQDVPRPWQEALLPKLRSYAEKYARWRVLDAGREKQDHESRVKQALDLWDKS
jgi:hypothetical protein